MIKLLDVPILSSKRKGKTAYRFDFRHARDTIRNIPFSMEYELRDKQREALESLADASSELVGRIIRRTDFNRKIDVSFSYEPGIVSRERHPEPLSPPNCPARTPGSSRLRPVRI